MILTMEPTKYDFGQFVQMTKSCPNCKRDRSWTVTIRLPGGSPSGETKISKVLADKETAQVWAHDKLAEIEGVWARHQSLQDDVSNMKTGWRDA